MEENKLKDSKHVESEQYEEVAPKFQETEIKQKEIRTDSYFDGGLLELIGWKILSFLITGVTLGIARPWGECMLYSYQFKHTVYNGKRLKFEGTGGDLFVNYFKWIFFTIITLGIYAFVIPVRKTRWVISNIHFEDEEYIKEESFFDGKTIQLIGINILCKLLNLVSLNLLYPFTQCLRLKWINKHTIINRKKLCFDGRAINLFGKYILWTFLTIITFGIFGLWLEIKMLKWQTKNIHIKVVGEVEQKDKSLLIAIPIAIIGIIVCIIFIPKIASLLSTDISLEPSNKNFILNKISPNKNETLEETNNDRRMIEEVEQYIENNTNSEYKAEVPDNTSTTCPEGYEYNSYLGKCYIDIPMNWDDCQARGGDLYTSWEGVDTCTIYLD